MTIDADGHADDQAPDLAVTPQVAVPPPPPERVYSAAKSTIESMILRLWPFDKPFEPEEFWSDLIKWPPDVFALAAMILEDTGCYRWVVSPPAGMSWPPGVAASEWEATVRATAAAWVKAIDQSEAVPDLGKYRTAITTLFPRRLDELDDGVADIWQTICTLVELHAIADEACAGLGVPAAEAKYDAPAYFQRGNALLAERGTLSRLPLSIARVLPKFRTPQVGITIRSLSQHASVDRTRIKVSWRRIDDFSDRKDALSHERLNLLLVPWPLSVEDRAFKPASGTLANMDQSRFGFFEFQPEIPDFLNQLSTLVSCAKKLDRVHAVVFPEQALDENQFQGAVSILREHEVPLIIGGVRGQRQNFVRLVQTSRYDERYDQHKHHRWCVDATQIEMYDVAFSLHPARRWWESVDVRARSLQFVIANEWLLLCPLICEDLARIDPVGELIRRVGPTLVVALLEDGPQREDRWPARYATVLADDPGSSVLTLTSLGMAVRSTKRGKYPVSRIVGLWKDRAGVQPIELKEKAKGVLLGLCAEWATEWSADGRSDRQCSAQLTYGGMRQVFCDNA